MPTNNYQGLINQANITLKTKITTDAQLDTTIATGSFEHFANIIKDLSPAFSHSIASQLNDADEFYAPFMVSQKTMGELLHLIENQPGSISEYDPNLRVRNDNDPSNLLTYTIKTQYKMKTDCVTIQPEFQQAFINGATFGGWLAQKINRQIVLPHKRFLNSKIQKDILALIKNEKVVYVQNDYLPENTDLTIEAIIKVSQYLKEIGSTPSVLGNLGHDDTDLKWANARYNATEDTYQNDFPFKDHQVNTFKLNQLTLFTSPKTSMALKQALANVYHDNQLDIIKQFKGIVAGFQIPDNVVYVIDAGRSVWIEKVLDNTTTQVFAGNMAVDTYSHKWYRIGAFPWGIGMKLTLTKKPASDEVVDTTADITAEVSDEPLKVQKTPKTKTKTKQKGAK